MTSPQRRREAVIYVQQKLGISERRACAALGQCRGLQRKDRKRPQDEEALTADIIKLATQYGRYGYKRITALLRVAGWKVKAIRKSQNLSQQELARRLGLTFQMIQKYENGESRIAASTIFVLSDVLDVSITEFFEGLSIKDIKSHPPKKRKAS